MADGDIQQDSSSIRTWLLTDAAVATGDGVWVTIGPFRQNINIHVDGITTATVEIDGSSTSSIPANTNHGDQIGGNITADGHISLLEPPRWVKARVTAWTSGTISVYMTGSR